jgi:uncharacterized membrane protein
MSNPTRNRLLRLVQHRWHDERDAERALGPDGARRIAERIAASEKHHSGEIQVFVEAGLPWSYIRRHATARERAIAMFGKLRVWDTEHNNGVLIYLLLAEHRIEIVADRGLARQVDGAQWQAIVETMRGHFRAGRHAEGLDRAIDAVDGLLAQHFPLAAGASNPNELPDAPGVG